MKNLAKLLNLVFCVVLIGCSAKSVVAPEFEQTKPEVFALLPVEYPSSISRERADEVHKAVTNELKSKGLILLQNDVIERVCSTPSCPEKNELAQKYGIDAFFTLTLSSISKSNFLAGYYNSIAGTLILSSIDQKQLLKVEDSESEKGGLLFNTGQIFEGLKTTVTNARQSQLGSLSDKFAGNLVAKLPPFPTAKAVPEQIDVVLNNVELTLSNQDNARICAHGSASLDAVLFIDRRAINLRELKPGTYCGEFLLWGLVNSGTTLSVELRSAFGITQRKSLDTQQLAACQPEGLVSYSNPQRKLKLSCENIADAKQLASCQSNLTLCKDAHFELYAVDSKNSAYNRVASLPAASLERDSRTSGTYELLAISRNGARAVPVEINLQ